MDLEAGSPSLGWPTKERELIGVVVATLGRPGLIAPLLQRFREQTRRPDIVVLVGHQSADIPLEAIEDDNTGSFSTVVLYSPQGSSRQRNEGIRWFQHNTNLLEHDGILIFCDDDFVMRKDWVEAAYQSFQTDPSLAGLDGVVIADGVHKGSYSESDAVRILQHGAQVLSRSDTRAQAGEMASLYGCNMVARSSFVSETLFDEGMPFYGWLEDYDFSVRLGKFGRLRRSADLVGVHLGSTKTRSSGVRTGYTQISNPCYLWRKGTMPLPVAAKYIFKNLVINLVKSPFPEEFVDRRGRVLGNALALFDLVAGRLSPNRVAGM